MTPQMILDKMDQMIRLGFVNARMPEKMRVKVTLRDMPGGPFVTDWLPVLCPRASGDMQYDLPDVGDALAVGEPASLTDSDSGSVECLACYLIAVSIRNFLRRNGWSQVLCLFLSYGLEQGFVVGSMYGKQVPPVQNADKWHRTFRDGTTLEYDRATHQLMADIKGGATIRASGPLTLEAPIIYLRGTLVNTASDGSPGNAVISGGVQVLSGGISVPEGDVIASGVSLVSHTTEGVMPGDGVSGVPTGGSAESPGTEAKPLPQQGTPEYAAAVAAGIAEARELVSQMPYTYSREIDSLILCLPEIAVAMSARKKEEKKDADAQGWAYLADFFRRWLSTKVTLPESGEYKEDDYQPPHLFISWEWLDKYPRIGEKIEELIRDMKSKAFGEELAKSLNERKYLSAQKREFDFIPADLSDTGKWREWEASPKDTIEVPGNLFQIIKYGVDGLVASMGDFTLRALPRGYVEPNKEKGGHTITITHVAVYAQDGFNFDGAEALGFWNCEGKAFSPADPEVGRLLGNHNFRQFRKDTGYGGNFRIFTTPRMVDIPEAIIHDTSL